jgi:hypothetical protein
MKLNSFVRQNRKFWIKARKTPLKPMKKTVVAAI